MNDTQFLNAVERARSLAARPGAEAWIGTQRSPFEHGQTVTLTITAYVPDVRPVPIPSCPELFDGDVIVRGGADA